MRAIKKIAPINRKPILGFTLIELLVVIAVIGILTSLIMVNFNAARARARDVERKSDLDQIKKALQMYYNDFGFYPEDDEGRIKACDRPRLEWGEEEFKCGEMVYMKVLPEDPTAGSTYHYSQQASGQDFCLWATLENKSDGDIAQSQARCADCSVGAGDYVVCAD